MTSVLIAIALKSLLIAGITVGLLALTKRRSAAERSWIAHIGLFALVVMSIAPLVMPRWTVEVPTLTNEQPLAPASVPASVAPQIAVPRDATTANPAPSPALEPGATSPRISGSAAASIAYALPAAILLLMTFLALARLIALRARADVLVDGHWLSALARAQRRMGFKHGTALLISNELASPISWGLMRPVILLNERAVQAAGEAEAIIAHELAHVARMDWIKLLLARVATALFWFNPLVWLLAREAHQLREETADDAVLGADIVDTDYAQLLVGVARHECPGMLLGAHGVAPSKSSLARRVARVLDGKSVRGPVPRGFAAGVFVGALAVAAPLAALTFTPAGRDQLGTRVANASAAPGTSAKPVAAGVPTDLPNIIASGVSTSVATAAAAIAPMTGSHVEPDYLVTAPSGATVSAKSGVTIATAPSGATVTMYPPDGSGRRRVVAVRADGTRAVAYVDDDDEASATPHPGAIGTMVALKANGVTPEYVAAIRLASPTLRNATAEEVIGLKAVGVTPDYIRALAAAGYPNLSINQLEEVRAVGVTPAFVQKMRNAGVRASVSELVEMRALNVAPREVADLKASGDLSPERIRAIAVPRARVPMPPVPPPPPRDMDDPDEG